MDTQQHINQLQSRQLELLAIMTRSDNHAAKCLKEGLSFQETYPQDFDDYRSANEEYNANEATLETLAIRLEVELSEVDLIK